MKFALVYPNWDFAGSTYFGCQEPHYPLELLFAADQLRAAGHEPLLLDAHLEARGPDEVRNRITVNDAVAFSARTALDRMLAIT